MLCRTLLLNKHRRFEILCGKFYFQLILTDILNKKVHYTNDEGITWTSSYVAFEPDKLLLHPTENQWLLGYSVISMEVRIQCFTDL